MALQVLTPWALQVNGSRSPSFSVRALNVGRTQGFCCPDPDASAYKSSRTPFGAVLSEIDVTDAIFTKRCHIDYARR